MWNISLESNPLNSEVMVPLNPSHPLLFLQRSLGILTAKMGQKCGLEKPVPFIILSLWLLSHPVPSMAQKSAILLIGDGMGPTVISATRMHFKGVRGKLFLDKTKHRGTLTTYSKDNMVTDSAASATAMATGQKVNNGVLNWAPPPSQAKGTGRGKKLKTILEMAAEKGKSVGLITTVEFSHATPAAFYAHVEFRGMTPKIIKDLIASPVDLILGGGLKILSTYRKNLSSKFRVVTDIKKLRCDLKRPLVGGFFADRFPYIGDTKNKAPRKGALKKLVQFAINCLSRNEKGYFLMVESGQIDQALHQRNICNALYETQEFDQIAEFVVSRVNKKTTLVLATADHDTGGLAINGFLSIGKSDFFTKKPCWKGKVTKVIKNKQSKQRYEVLRTSTDGLFPEFMHSNDRDFKKPFAKSAHTAHDVDIFAWGLGAEKVYGLNDNTFVFTLLKEAMEL